MGFRKNPIEDKRLQIIEEIISRCHKCHKLSNRRMSKPEKSSGTVSLSSTQSDTARPLQPGQFIILAWYIQNIPATHTRKAMGGMLSKKRWSQRHNYNVMTFMIIFDKVWYLWHLWHLILFDKQRLLHDGVCSAFYESHKHRTFMPTSHDWRQDKQIITRESNIWFNVRMYLH